MSHNVGSSPNEYIKRNIVLPINIRIPVLFGYVITNDNDISKVVQINALTFGSKTKKMI